MSLIKIFGVFLVATLILCFGYYFMYPPQQVSSATDSTAVHCDSMCVDSVGCEVDSACVDTTK